MVIVDDDDGDATAGWREVITGEWSREREAEMRGDHGDTDLTPHSTHSQFRFTCSGVLITMQISSEIS